MAFKMNFGDRKSRGLIFFDYLKFKNYLCWEKKEPITRFFRYSKHNQAENSHKGN